MRLALNKHCFDKVEEGFLKAKIDIDISSSFKKIIGFNQLRNVFKSWLKGNLNKAFHILKADRGFGKTRDSEFFIAMEIL